VIAIMVAEVVTGIVVLTPRTLFALATEPRLAFEPSVPLALFSQVPLVFVFAHIPAKVLSAVVLARMVVSRRRNRHQRNAGQ